VSQLATRAEGLVPAEVTAFEDTEAGIASAKAAGMHCIAVAGTLPRHRLAQADEIVETIDEPLMRRILD
jgi:beta-phosphoglucomutase-like phosphatase (HAD superfamily)